MASTYRSPLDVILSTVVRFENRMFGGGLQNDNKFSWGTFRHPTIYRKL